MTVRKIISTNQEFTIGKIVCLARNYAEHAAEHGVEVPDEPESWATRLPPLRCCS